MLVGSRCFAFSSFLTARLFNLHSLSNHFLVTVLVTLLLRLILPRLRDCEAASHRMFSNDWTASSTPISELGKSQFMKSPINSWVCCDINASVNKLSDYSSKQTAWVGNFSSVWKSKTLLLLALWLVFVLLLSHVTIWLWSEIVVGGFTTKNSIFWNRFWSHIT